MDTWRKTISRWWGSPHVINEIRFFPLGSKYPTTIKNVKWWGTKWTCEGGCRYELYNDTDFSLAEISASCALMSAICASNATILASRLAYLKGYQHLFATSWWLRWRNDANRKSNAKVAVPREKEGGDFRKETKWSGKDATRSSYNFLSFDWRSLGMINPLVLGGITLRRSRRWR